MDASRVKLPRLIRRLVLDGALLVKAGREFVTGFEASFLLPESTADVGASSVSARALEYGASLPLSDVSSLAARLYGFHRLPLTPRWRHAFGSPHDVLDYLRLSHPSPMRRSLDRGWTVLDSQPDSPWIRWRRRGRQGPGHALFKIYVSMRLTDLAATLPAVLDVVMSTPGVSSFKFGADADSLLRSDNLVLYCRSMSDLRTTVGRLAEGVGKSAAHGVPFTAPARPDHLVSWGIDPPLQYCQTRGESWRTWIALRLAAYLTCARATGAETSAQRARFALGRLALDGVDVARWRPGALVSSESPP